MAKPVNAFLKIQKLSDHIEQVAAEHRGGSHTHPINDIAGLQNKLDLIDGRLDDLDTRVKALEKPKGT